MSTTRKPKEVTKCPSCGDGILDIDDTVVYAASKWKGKQLQVSAPIGPFCSTLCAASGLLGFDITAQSARKKDGRHAPSELRIVRPPTDLVVPGD